VSALLERWHGLQARERILLLVCAAAVLATLYVVGVLEPLGAREKRLGRALLAETELQAWLEAQRAVVTPAAGFGAARERLPDGASLLAAINASAGENGIAAQLTRVTPTGGRGLSLNFSAVPYAAFMRWLLLLDERYGADVERIRMDQGKDPGVVDVELSLMF
jgi:general secretion pathway protein M